MAGHRRWIAINARVIVASRHVTVALAGEVNKVSRCVISHREEKAKGKVMPCSLRVALSVPINHRHGNFCDNKSPLSRVLTSSFLSPSFTLQQSGMLNISRNVLYITYKFRFFTANFFHF